MIACGNGILRHRLSAGMAAKRGQKRFLARIQGGLRIQKATGLLFRTGDRPMASPQEPQPSSSPPFDWKALSQKTWVIIVAGLALPPLGMILTWLKPGWTSRTRWIATGMMCMACMAWIGADKRRERNIQSEARSDSSAEGEANTDEQVTSAYDEGYRYARGILAAAERAPPSAKRQIMQPLVDLAEEAERGSRTKPQQFYKGVSQAMLEAMNNAGR